MEIFKPDIEPDIPAVVDRQESVNLMEPLLIAEGSRHRGELTISRSKSPPARPGSGAACQMVCALPWPI